MPAFRFFIDSDLVEGSVVILKDAEYHHLVHVIRTGVNEHVELVNGRGGLASGKVMKIEKKAVAIQVEKTIKKTDASLKIFLAVPLIRTSKLEWVVEKGTEIGVNGFFLFSAERVKTKPFSSAHIERLRNIEIAAIKQSGRLYLPSLAILPSLSSLFVHEALFFFGDTRASELFDSFCIKAASQVIFISGPEEGFSSAELAFLDQRARGISLSEYTLRTETAPLVAASILEMSRLKIFPPLRNGRSI